MLVSWNQLKKFSNDLGCPIIWSQSTEQGLNRYDLHVTHKGLAVGCVLIANSNDVEISEFESEYKGEIVELWVSEKVNSLSEESSYYTPPAGSKVVILSFHAEAPYNQNAVCKLLWQFNTQEETSIWTTQGSSSMPFKYTIPTSDTDGVKQLAISCDNATLGGLLMSSYVKLLVINNA